MFMVELTKMANFLDLLCFQKVNTKKVIIEQYRFFVSYSGKGQP